jgi:hypothetical protein
MQEAFQRLVYVLGPDHKPFYDSVLAFVRRVNVTALGLGE